MRSLKLKNAHVGRVKEPGCLAHGMVLFRNACEPPGHLPSRKPDEAGLAGLVARVQRRGAHFLLFSGDILVLLIPHKFRKGFLGAKLPEQVLAHKVGDIPHEAICVAVDEKIPAPGPAGCFIRLHGRKPAVVREPLFLSKIFPAIPVSSLQPTRLHRLCQRLCHLFGSYPEEAFRIRSAQKALPFFQPESSEASLRKLLCRAAQTWKIPDRFPVPMESEQGSACSNRVRGRMKGDRTFHFPVNVLRVEDQITIGQTHEPGQNPFSGLCMDRNQKAVLALRGGFLPKDEYIIHQSSLSIEQKALLEPADFQTGCIPGCRLLHKRRCSSALNTEKPEVRKNVESQTLFVGFGW